MLTVFTDTAGTMRACSVLVQLYLAVLQRRRGPRHGRCRRRVHAGGGRAGGQAGERRCRPAVAALDEQSLVQFVQPPQDLCPQSRSQTAVARGRGGAAPGGSRGGLAVARASSRPSASPAPAPSAIGAPSTGTRPSARVRRQAAAARTGGHVLGMGRRKLGWLATRMATSRFSSLWNGACATSRARRRARRARCSARVPRGLSFPTWPRRRSMRRTSLRTRTPTRTAVRCRLRAAVYSAPEYSCRVSDSGLILSDG